MGKQIKNKRVKYSDDRTVTVTLKYPVTYDKQMVEQVTLRTSCLVQDLEAMEAGDKSHESARLMLAALSALPGASPGTFKEGKPAPFFRKLESIDYFLLSRVATAIIGSASEDEDDEDDTEGKSEGEDAHE